MKPAAEELVVYVLLVLIGAIPVVTAVASGERFEAEPTLGLLMVAAGLAGACGHVRLSCSARAGDIRRLLR